LESGSIFVLGNFLFFIVVFILFLATMNMTLIYLIISELTLFHFLMFSITLLLDYFDYMLSVVRLELCLCIGSYSACSLGQWVSGRYCVGEVPRLYLSMITPYSPDREVDRKSDSPVGSSCSPPPDYKDCRAPLLQGSDCYVHDHSYNITMHNYNLLLR